MKHIIKILWALVKLPFKLLAVVLVIPITIFGIMINIVLNMGGVLIGLFNTFILLAVFGIIYAKDWGMFWSVGAIVLVEAILFFSVGVIQGIIEVTKDRLLSFGSSYGIGMV